MRTGMEMSEFTHPNETEMENSRVAFTIAFDFSTDPIYKNH